MNIKVKNKRSYCKRSKKFATVAMSPDVMLAQQYCSILKKNGINALVRNDYDAKKGSQIMLMVPPENLEEARRIIEPISSGNDFFSSIYDLDRDLFRPAG